MPRRKQIPSYRLQKQSGQGIVTLPDGMGGRRVSSYDHAIMVACDAAFPPPPPLARLSSAAMLAEWDKWSRSAPEKYAEEACAKKWASFGKRGGITIGSLIYWAKCEGWHRPSGVSGGIHLRRRPKPTGCTRRSAYRPP